MNYPIYQEKFNTFAIDPNLICIEVEPTIEEKNNNIVKNYFVISMTTNMIEMKAILKNNKDFIMQIRTDLETYLINKIKVTIKMNILKTNPYEHPEFKEKLYQKNQHPKQEENSEIEQEYLKYALRSSTVFQMSQIDKDYLQYFISHTNKELDNNMLSFIYMVLDKFLDTLTNLPNRELLQKTVTSEKEIIFNLKENNIEMNTISNGYLMFIDLNNLKAMNDIYGHNVADVLLKTFAKILKEDFKTIAHFRIGGDEFISTSNNWKEIEKLSNYLHSLEFNKKIKKMIEIETLIEIDENLLFFASNGIYTIDLSKNNLHKTLQFAEEKMYVNKSFLHLEYGIYDRRTEGEGEPISGKLDKETVNKIKNSPQFNKLNPKEQYEYLSKIKKYALELDNLQKENKKRNNNKNYLEAKIKELNKNLNNLLNKIIL